MGSVTKVEDPKDLFHPGTVCLAASDVDPGPGKHLSKIISPLDFYVLIKSYLHLKDVVCNVVDDLCVCQRLKDVNAKVDDVEEHVGDALLVVPALDCHAWFNVWEVQVGEALEWKHRRCHQDQDEAIDQQQPCHSHNWQNHL